MEQDAQERPPSVRQRRQFNEARVEDVSHGVRYAAGAFWRAPRVLARVGWSSDYPAAP